MVRMPITKQVRKAPGDSLQNLEALLTSERVKTVAMNVLIIAGMAGAVGMLLTAPNTLKVLAPFLRRRYKRPLRHSEQAQKLVRAVYYLKQSGQIIIEEKGGKLLARLTEKGQGRLRDLNKGIYQITKPAHWAGTWWLVAADIPTREYRAGADMLRAKLRELQFYSLQRTLWIHPFDPRKELGHIAIQYHVAHFVTVMEIIRLDVQDKERLLRFFKQKKLL